METSISDITIMTSFCMMQVFTKNLHHTKAGHNRTDISKVSFSIDTEQTYLKYLLALIQNIKKYTDIVLV